MESDDYLVRYLLGELPDADVERLDERSITDGAIAARLRHLENDLVDRYSRGELPVELRDRIDRAMRTSPHLRDKVRFAETLRAVAAPGTAVRSTPAERHATRAWARAMAAAAVLLLFAAGYAGLQNLRLRREMSQLELQRGRIEQQNAELQREADRARTAPPQRQTVTATFLLPPPRRGLDDGTTVLSLAPGTTDVTLRLIVETDEYSVFWAAVKDPATSEVRWRSSDLPAANEGNERVVAFGVPAGVLEARRYLVELSAIAQDGQGELIGQYPVRMVLE